MDGGTSPCEQTKNLSPTRKNLGGSSSTNAMAYVRGNRADYDGWAALGNKGWSYDEVLPYFIRSENHQYYDTLDTAYHGNEGPLSVGQPKALKRPFQRVLSRPVPLKALHPIQIIMAPLKLEQAWCIAPSTTENAPVQQ